MSTEKKTREFSVDVPRWVGYDWQIGHVLRAIDQGQHEQAMNSMSTYSPAASSDFSKSNIKVGFATVKVTIADEQTILERTVDALRAEKAKARADAQAKATEIEGKIQKLLAIGHDASVLSKGGAVEIVEDDDDLPF